MFEPTGTFYEIQERSHATECDTDEKVFNAVAATSAELDDD
jgi:hypothetical protein